MITVAVYRSFSSRELISGSDCRVVQEVPASVSGCPHWGLFCWRMGPHRVFEGLRNAFCGFSEHTPGFGVPVVCLEVLNSAFLRVPRRLLEFHRWNITEMIMAFASLPEDDCINCVVQRWLSKKKEKKLASAFRNRIISLIDYSAFPPP